MQRIGMVTWLAAGLTALAAPSGDRMFQADFNRSQEKPLTAPSVQAEPATPPGPVTVDFNNLKDPQYTPDFQLRNPVKFQVPGFSSCYVTDQGTMEIDLDRSAGCVRLHGGNPAVSGYIGRRFLSQEPTTVEATVQRLRPEEGGQLYLQVSDLMSGASVQITAVDGKDLLHSWQISVSDGTGTPVKTELQGSPAVDWGKPVKLTVTQVAPGIFQVSVDGQAAGAPVTVRELRHMTEMRVGGEARKDGFKVLEVAAWRHPAALNPDPSVREYTTAAAKPRDAAFKATNPYGNAENIDYPFRGFSDAMADPELFGELAATLRELNLKLLRFPGGGSAYFYSIHPESLPVFGSYYYACDPKCGRWVDARQYFKLCKAVGADALYQLNLGYYYDPADKKAYSIGPVDGPQFLAGADGYVKSAEKQDNYRPEKLAAAVAEAKIIAGWAKAAGVKVVWEFGNEDYTKYAPTTFVRLCKAFQDGVRQVDPQAQFVICGDGITWSDWRWPFALFAEANRQHLDLAYTAQHVYLFGGVGFPFTDGQATYDGMLQAWRNIRFLHQSVRNRLDKTGYPQTKLAITEGGVAAAGPLPNAPQEHGMGRSLAEAAIYPARIRQYAMLVHHDLVRNDSPEKAGTWFCRIFYRPDNPKGKRYELPLDALVMKETGRHGLREIIFDSGDGTTVSQWTDGLLVTSGNPYPVERRVRLALNGFTPAQTQLTAAGWRSPDLTVMEHAPIAVPVTVTPAANGRPAQAEFTLPPYSFGHFQLQ